MCFVVHGDPDGFGWDRRHEGYEYFRDFMVFLVKRAPEVKFWELFNEMDTIFGNLFGAHKHREGYPLFERGRCYAQMLKIVASGSSGTSTRRRPARRTTGLWRPRSTSRSMPRRTTCGT